MSDVNQYDVGVDHWNKLYKELKDGLLLKYGIAGPSPRTGNPMPKIPWANAVVIGIQFAAWTAEALALYGARVQSAATPLLKVVRRPDGVELPSVKVMGEANQGYWDTFDAQKTIDSYLQCPVVSTGYLLTPHPLTVLFQRDLDLTNRLDRRGPMIVGINRDGGLGINPAHMVDVQWFGTGVREYTRLTHLPAECTGINNGVGRGPFGNLDAAAADMFLSRVYAATQTLAVRIPDVSYLDAVEAMIQMTAEVAAKAVNVAAKAAGEGLNWTAEQLGKTAATFLDNLNFYGVIAMLGAGIYIMR